MGPPGTDRMKCFECLEGVMWTEGPGDETRRRMEVVLVR